METFAYRLPVRFHDVDPAGIVFFARIFHYAHDAYEAWMRRIGWPLDRPILDRGYAIPLAHAEADFHHPIRLGQEIQVELTVAAIGTSSYTIRCRISLTDGTALASVETVHVCMDPQMGKSLPLPESLRAALQSYLAEKRSGDPESAC